MRMRSSMVGVKLCECPEIPVRSSSSSFFFFDQPTAQTTRPIFVVDGSKRVF